jgi:leader peptidase (prepilin peptidase)/N-methyltransferase
MLIVPCGWFAPVVAGALGLGFGIVAAEVVDRWPRGEPVLRSWPRRGGYAGPLIACACAMTASAVVAFLGVTWEALAVAALALTLVPVVVIDLRHRLIPDLLVVPATAIALSAAMLADPAAWWIPVTSALGAGGFMLALWIVHPEGMGLGDVKLAALMGAALGPSVIPALAVAFGGGTLLGLALLARMGLRARAVAVPFGPFLAAGALAALWAGQPMLDWYAATLA